MFGFPKIERDDCLQLKTNIIKSSVFQIKFPTIPDLLSHKTLLQEKLEKSFPIRKDIIQQTGEFRFSNEGTPILESAASSKKGFEFRSADNNIVVAIVSDSMTLTIFGKAYTNFKGATDIIENNLIPIAKQLGVESLDRIAIRKVNVLDILGTNGTSGVQDYFQLMSMIYNDALTTGTTAVQGSSTLEKSVSFLSLCNPENFKLNLSYGLLEQNPSTPKIRQLILDIDIYKADNLNISQALTELRKINDEVYNIFTWSLKPEFVNSLKG